MSNRILLDDLLQIVLDYAWGGINTIEFYGDIAHYTKWHQTVPRSVLNVSVMYKNRPFHRIASPYIAEHAFVPRSHLALLPFHIWNTTLESLVNMLCKERIRAIRTYKKCAMRWVHDCVWNLQPEYYRILHEKLLCKLKEEHFRPRVRGWQFVDYMLSSFRD